jgi:hypothetical protein
VNGHSWPGNPHARSQDRLQVDLDHRMIGLLGPYASASVFMKCSEGTHTIGDQTASSWTFWRNAWGWDRHSDPYASASHGVIGVAGVPTEWGILVHPETTDSAWATRRPPSRFPSDPPGPSGPTTRTLWPAGVKVNAERCSSYVTHNKSYRSLRKFPCVS